MVEISYKGSGTASSESADIGKGQGLQVGITKIEFNAGKITLASDIQKSIGRFKTISQKGGNSNTIKAFAFKAATKCSIQWKESFFDYNLLNEWVIFSGLEVDKIDIVRSETGLSPDVFDWSFTASDNANYNFHIEKGTRDSDVETVFSSASRAAGTYTQNINTQNASSIILAGKATLGDGTATITIETFDPASNSWIEHVPVKDIFTLINGESKRADIGKGISKNPLLKDLKYFTWTNNGSVQLVKSYDLSETFPAASELPFGIGGHSIGYSLPAGDAILRVKVVVATASLTFSIGLIKVF